MSIRRFVIKVELFSEMCKFKFGKLVVELKMNLSCEIIECMDSNSICSFFYLISGKMQKSNVTSFLRVVLKKLARKLVRLKN